MMDQNYLVEKLTEYRNRELKECEKKPHTRDGGITKRSFKGWMAVLTQLIVRDSGR